MSGSATIKNTGTARRMFPEVQPGAGGFVLEPGESADVPIECAVKFCGDGIVLTSGHAAVAALGHKQRRVAKANITHDERALLEAAEAKLGKPERGK